jgi:S1-C subfamily serine protease
MKKRIAAIVLAVVLAVVVLPGAAAVNGGFGNFTKIHPYQSGHFTDIATSKWYTPYVQAAYEFGLVNGTSDSTFSPDAALTVGEAVKLAACLHNLYGTGTEVFAASDPWYATYAEYALKNGIIPSAYPEYNTKATRSEFAQILSKAFPAEALAGVNTIADGAIPDVPSGFDYAPAVYKLYRAGIFTGSDVSGRFLPNTTITRAEVAAAVVRMADASFRQRIVLNPGLTTEQIYDQCSPAVFFIKIYDMKDTAIKTGSGFFIDKDGLAVTNFHVINGAARAVITTADGKDYDIAGVYDYSKDKDLALIKVSGGSSFAFLKTANSDTVVTGADAYAIGSPLGFKNTISKGIISSASRTLDGRTYIQTTAAISPGSSGGALLDSIGRVIGVTTMTATGAQNINLAAPIELTGSFETTTLKTLQSILPNTTYYANHFPVPDFGAYFGVPAFQSSENSLLSTYYYRVSDLNEEEKTLSGYTGLLEDNVFQFYGYAIESGKIISYYTNSAYNIILTVGTVQQNDTECIRIQIM